MARTEARQAASTPETQIHVLHRGLALGLGAMAGLILIARGPAHERATSDVDDASTASTGAADRGAPSRAELDAAVARLGSWLDRSSRSPRTALETNRRLLALGRSALEQDPAAVAASLERLLALRGTPSAPVPAAVPARAFDGEPEASAAATLAILLEAGTPLESELPLRGGHARLSELLELALPAASRASADDPWALDLLSFGLLAGHGQQRDALARRLSASLLELERGQRLPVGPDAADDGARSLVLGTSVFRAIAVLGDPSFEQPGLRYLNALVRRHQLVRERWREQLGRARSGSERDAIHLASIERLGQLEQALFGAHLAFRRGQSPEPAAGVADGMRRAAGDLLEHLAALERSGAFARDAAAPELLTAAAQAVRGLRAARVAL